MDAATSGSRRFLGRQAALATMHAKERVIAPALEARLGLFLVVPSGIDTDRFGTFTGDVPRAGSMREAALAKARHGMAASGLALGVASEGSHGPHPSVPFAVAGIELVVLVDDAHHIVIEEFVVDEHTNHAHTLTREGRDLDGFLSRIGFPAHAVVVRPEGELLPGAPIVKGINCPDALVEAVARCREAAASGLALVQSDLRAHVNPTRMRAIARAAGRLAARAATACPGCDTPGFGVVEVVTGLPCRDCGAPGTRASHRVHGCVACDYRFEEPVDGAHEGADPMWCGTCNP